MRWAWLLIVAVVGVLGAWLALGSYANPPPADTAVAELGTIREFVDEQGQTRLPKTYLVTMPYNGRVESIDLVEGADVKAGDVVAKVAPREIDLEIDAATAEVRRLDAALVENDDVSVEQTGLQQALSFVASMDLTVQAARERVKAGKARLDYANDHLERTKGLHATRTASQDGLDKAKVDQIESQVEHQQDQLVLAALESMQAATALLPTLIRQYIDRKNLAHDVLHMERTQADVRVLQAKNNADRGVMKSEVDGTVLNRLESNERHVSAGTVLLEIGDLDQLEVEADVLSQDAVRIQPGAEVEIYGPVIGLRPVVGRVTRVFPAGFTKISSLGVEQQRVKIIVAIDPEVLARLREQRGLGVGYRVRVRVFTAQRSGTLLVPRTAMFRGPAGGWQAFVIREGRARLVNLKIGLLNDSSAEVIDGVAAGEQVVLSPETTLADGARVRGVPGTHVNTPAAGESL